MNEREANQECRGDEAAPVVPFDNVQKIAETFFRALGSADPPIAMGACQIAAWSVICGLVTPKQIGAMVREAKASSCSLIGRLAKLRELLLPLFENFRGGMGVIVIRSDLEGGPTLSLSDRERLLAAQIAGALQSPATSNCIPAAARAVIAGRLREKEMWAYVSASRAIAPEHPAVAFFWLFNAWESGHKTNCEDVGLVPAGLVPIAWLVPSRS